MGGYLKLFFASIFAIGTFVAQTSYACPGTDLEKELIQAIGSHDLNCVKTLASQISNLNLSVTTPSDGLTNWGTSLSPIGYAARVGSADSIQILIDNGANVNEQDKYGNSPVAVAAFYKKVDAVKFLAKKGAYLNYNVCKYGKYFRECYSPLAMALHTPGQQTTLTIEALLQLGASPNLAVLDTLPLALATIDLNLVDLLVKHGAVPDLRNTSGRTALFFCYTSKCVNKLIAVGAEVNAEAFNGCTALDYAWPSDFEKALVAAGGKLGPACKK